MIAASPGDALTATAHLNVAFARNGRYGVCLRAADGHLTLERWALETEEAAALPIPGVVADPEAHALPLDDGRILCLQRHQADGLRHEVVLLEPDGDRPRWQRLGEIPALLGGYLLPGPRADQLGVAVTLDAPEQATIWRLSAAPPRIEPIMQVPGLLSGGVWLDDDGSALALNQARAVIEDGACGDRRSSGIAVDLRARSWRRIWSVSDTSTDRIVLYSARTQRFVVTTNACGEQRLGCAVLGQRGVRFPEALHRPGYPRQAMAFDDCGERLLVHETAGATSRLFVYTPAQDRSSADRIEPIAGSPAGTVSAPASWTGDVVRFRFSASSQPPALATVRLGAEPRWSLSPDAGRDGQPAWAPAELTELCGPTGPIEAICYGGPDWRRRSHLVVALHGGPLAAWRFEFEPLFQCLAAAGVAVVAPNYRGSTGYGTQHLQAVVGDWGGPDLDDVLHLGRDLEEERRRLHLRKPVVLGVSYGAFLALLAACQGPQLWSACVALAPLLSGPSLHRSGGAGVQHRIERLGGLTRSDGGSAPRDVLHACASLSLPLLLIHGTRDETIPVEQSRRLRRRLVELGRIEGVDFDYLEVDGDHTDVALAWPRDLRQAVVRFAARTHDPQRTTHSERR